MCIFIHKTNPEFTPIVIYTANTTKSHNSSSNNDYKGHIRLMDQLFSHALHISAKDRIKKHIRD